MAKIIKFKNKKDLKLDNDAKKLVKIADELDAIIIKYLRSSKLEPIDIAAVLAHRLGNVLWHMENKEKVWEFCEEVAKKQAKIKRDAS